MGTKSKLHVLLFVSLIANAASAAYIAMDLKASADLKSVTHVSVPSKAKKQKQSNSAKKAAPPTREGFVQEAIREKKSDLELCYNGYLATRPHVTDGSVRIDWRIDERGGVAAAEIVKSDLSDPILQNCMIEKVKQWRFPTPPGNEPLNVAHRFNFQERTPSSIEFEVR